MKGKKKGFFTLENLKAVQKMYKIAVALQSRLGEDEEFKELFSLIQGMTKTYAEFYAKYGKVFWMETPPEQHVMFTETRRFCDHRLPRQRKKKKES
jgi:hypothetical protein